MRSLAALLLALASPASAATITYSFTGTVSFVDSGLTSVFSNGQAATASFQIESTTPDTGSGDDFGFYQGVSNITLTLGTYTGSAAGGTSNEALEISDAPSGVPGSIDDLGLTIQPYTGAAVGAFQPFRIQLGLEDQDTASAFSSDALPLALDLSEFEAKSFGFFFTDGAIFVGAFATMDTVTITVPEPGAFPLIALSMALFALRRRS